MNTSYKTFFALIILILAIFGVYFLIRDLPTEYDQSVPVYHETVSLQDMIVCASDVGIVANSDSSLVSQLATNYVSYDINLEQGTTIPKIIAADVASSIGSWLCEFSTLYSDTTINEDDRSFIKTIQENDPSYRYSYFANLHPVIVDRWEITNYMTSAYQFSGGAHGIGTIQNIILDTQNNRRVIPTEFFRPDATEPIKTIVAQKLTSILGEMMNNDMLQDGLNNPEVLFGLVIPTDTGITFKFQSYDVAPYAAGQPEVYFDFTELTPFLTDAWKVRLGL